MAAARPARYLAALCVALIAAYVVVWAHVSAMDIGRSDFTSTYVGGTLLREGHRADLYSDPLQAALHTTLIAPDREGNLPFVDAPLAALVASPVTLFPLQAAYRLWAVLQLAILVLAVLIAARAAPWPRDVRPAHRAVAVLAALACAGTLPQLLQAQWTPVTALGLALAYRDWRAGQYARGAALFAVCAALAKPHLALGIAAFMLGWRDRRVVFGALAGGLAAAAASVALIGPEGVGGFAQALTGSATRWDLATFVSFIGFPGALIGNGTAAQVAGIGGTVAACAVAAWLGARVRRDATLLEPALAGAAVLSLLAAPHVLMHDLVLIAPAAVWSVAYALRRGGDRTATLLTSLAPFGVLTLAGLSTIGGGALAVAHGGMLAPGAVVTPALLLLAGTYVAATMRGGRAAVHATTRPAMV